MSRLALAALLWASLVPAPPARAQAADLAEAYQKEFAFLEAEKSALEARLREVRAEGRRDVGAAEGGIAHLQKRIIEARAEAERLEETLAEVERANERAAERADVLGETLERAHGSLAEAGVELPPVPEDRAAQVAALGPLAEAAADLMARGGEVRRAPGSFFLSDGTQVDGTVVHLGRVAAWGVSDAASGALAPAGQGRLRLWDEDASATARAVATGAWPETLRVFLYDNLEKRIDPKHEKTWREIVESGGVIAWVIVGLGALALLLILLRGTILAVAGAGTDRLIRTVLPLVREGRVHEAAAVTKKARGPAARVLRSTLSALHKPRVELEDVASEAILLEIPRIERFGAAISVFAAVAPLLGLLGTVTGMISTFDIITEHGTGDPKLLSGGISEALVTTELGLIVAIPALLVGTLLAGRANRLQHAIEGAALQVMNAAPPSVREGGPLAEAPAPSPATEEEEPAWSTSSSSSSAAPSSAAAS